MEALSILNWEKLIFLFSILSIVIGSCIMRIVDCFSHLIPLLSSKSKNTFYWAHLVALLMLLLMLLFYWFNIFDWPVSWKQKTSSSFLVYISTLVYPVLLYMVILILTPKLSGKTNVKLHFYKHRKTIFIVFTIASIYICFHDLILLDQKFLYQKHFLRILGAFFTLILASVNKKLFNKIFLWIMLLLTVIYLVYLFISK